MERSDIGVSFPMHRLSMSKILALIPRRHEPQGPARIAVPVSFVHSKGQRKPPSVNSSKQEITPFVNKLNHFLLDN